MIDLTNKRFVILGLQGSGKTTQAKHILGTVKNHIVYDVHHEYQGFNRYFVENIQVRRPGDNNDPAIAELNRFVTTCVLGPGLIRLFVLDEANRYCPNKYPLPSSILTLNDDNRHDRIAFGAVARRAAQLNTDLIELAHYLFIYRLVGKNDWAFLESQSEGLGDAVRTLPDFHYCLVHPDRHFEVCKPVSV
jgi:hypothetical protein